MPDGVVGVEQVGQTLPLYQLDALYEFRLVDTPVFHVLLHDVGFDTGANQALHVLVQLGRVGEGDAADGYAAGVLAANGVADREHARGAASPAVSRRRETAPDSANGWGAPCVRLARAGAPGQSGARFAPPRNARGRARAPARITRELGSRRQPAGGGANGTKRE